MSDDVGRSRDGGSIYSGNDNATTYAKYRPSYPKTIFEELRRVTPGRRLAFDAATGTGQAALRLAEWFEKVVAVDLSQDQINEAVKLATRLNKRNAEFRAARAEDSGLATDSADLITCAQGLHWLDVDRFYAEVERVLRMEGVLAVWCFTLPRVSESVDPIVRALYNSDKLWPYWSHWRPLVDSAYRGIRPPFGTKWSEFKCEMRETWGLDHFRNYLRTWSAIRQAEQDPDLSAHINDSIEAIAREWGDSNVTKTIQWEVQVRADSRLPEFSF